PRGADHGWRSHGRADLRSLVAPVRVLSFATWRRALTGGDRRVCGAPDAWWRVGGWWLMTDEQRPVRPRAIRTPRRREPRKLVARPGRSGRTLAILAALVIG